jgi:hypothetical protein
MSLLDAFNDVPQVLQDKRNPSKNFIKSLSLTKSVSAQTNGINTNGTWGLSINGITSAEDIADLRVPESLGVVTKAYRGEGKKAVVLLQDYHCNYEAQKNIKKILTVLGDGQLYLPHKRWTVV